ncbi:MULTISPECIES: hypothetical protein [Methylomicrobium]|uniref:hypothetical protein n=1 Tax=Methylomicrobium TaxID=39773 RepID=UPI0012F6B550|nr:MULTISPECIES: hypothetical protein [Methylomicrobium]
MQIKRAIYGKAERSVEFPSQPNVRVIERPNTGFDFGGRSLHSYETVFSNRTAISAMPKSKACRSISTGLVRHLS